MPNTYNIPTVENSTFEEKLNDVSEKLDNMTLMLAAIAENSSDIGDGSGIYFRNPKVLQQLTRMGLASRVLNSYSYIVINKETGITAAAHGSGVTNVSVNDGTFVEKIGEAETKEYEFKYDGAAWIFKNEAVVLSEYGITITGTPATDDTIVIHETAESKRYDILGIDHDVPADPNLKHTTTLCAHDVSAYNGLAYKKPQGLFWVDPEKYPNGLTAGTFYYFESDCCCYDNTAKEDGIYGFTPTKNIPADGLVRHTALGLYQASAASHSKARVLAGTFATYGTRADGRTQIEAGLATVEGDGTSGVLLGTITAETYSKRVTPECNLTRRNAYGSNYYLGSDERAWMRSDAAKGTQANGLYLWQKELGIFDLPATYNAAGNLHGMDPRLLDVIGAVRKRTYLHAVDRTDQSVKYVDSSETVFPLSMNEANLGTANDGVYENAVNLDGTVKTTPYEYFARRTTNADRIKYQAGTARTWFLRSPIPSNCHLERHCTADGALGSYNANYAFGAVDAFNIV